MSEKIREFYDSFVSKLLNDYLNGNKRMEEAIYFGIDNIQNYGKSILDIGCGIGWSSYEFHRNIKESVVYGVDLSEQLIGIAKNLFKDENLNYMVVDITKNKLNFNNKFDVVVLLDVYEHIQVKFRKHFHDSLKNILAENFKIILTCPTIYHQEFLRKNKPDGLQPVDEDIALNEIIDLANDLNAEVVLFDYKSIWRKYDYFHAVIERINHFSPLSNTKNKKYTLEKNHSKKKRIKKLEL